MNSLLESYQAKVPAAFAVLGIRTTGELLTDIVYLPRSVATLKPQTRFAAEVCEQIAAYLKNPAFRFDLPFEFHGTDFQQRVWNELCEIPLGETVSYGELARRLGTPGASRAVGLANGRNPVSIVVPCHRVIGANGRLTGYGGGLQRKAWLLRHEAEMCGSAARLFAEPPAGA
jgi:methylated-DNA-[protein]-cysteine S-methyltransferase